MGHGNRRDFDAAKRSHPYRRRSNRPADRLSEIRAALREGLYRDTAVINELLRLVKRQEGEIRRLEGDR